MLTKFTTAIAIACAVAAASAAQASDQFRVHFTDMNGPDYAYVGFFDETPGNVNVIAVEEIYDYNTQSPPPAANSTAIYGSQASTPWEFELQRLNNDIMLIVAVDPTVSSATGFAGNRSFFAYLLKDTVNSTPSSQYWVQESFWQFPFFEVDSWNSVPNCQIQLSWTFGRRLNRCFGVDLPMSAPSVMPSGTDPDNIVDCLKTWVNPATSTNEPEGVIHIAVNGGWCYVAPEVDIPDYKLFPANNVPVIIPHIIEDGS